MLSLTYASRFQIWSPLNEELGVASEELAFEYENASRQLNMATPLT